jgi:hypothetical protein
MITKEQRIWAMGDTLYSDGGMFSIQHIDRKGRKVTLVNCTTHVTTVTNLESVKHLKILKGKNQ